MVVFGVGLGGGQDLSEKKD